MQAFDQLRFLTVLSKHFYPEGADGMERRLNEQVSTREPFQSEKEKLRGRVGLPVV